MKTVGQILSIERNSKNLSISDIVIELKISKSIIIDLENDNIKKNSDIILCENTKNSSKLFKKYSIEAKYHKYTDHDFDKKKGEILQNLKQKKQAVLEVK